LTIDGNCIRIDSCVVGIGRYCIQLIDVLILKKWECPSCQNFCNCAACRRKRGVTEYQLPDRPIFYDEIDKAKETRSKQSICGVCDLNPKGRIEMNSKFTYNLKRFPPSANTNANTINTTTSTNTNNTTINPNTISIDSQSVLIDYTSVLQHPDKKTNHITDQNNTPIDTDPGDNIEMEIDTTSVPGSNNNTKRKKSSPTNPSPCKKARNTKTKKQE